MLEQKAVLKRQDLDLQVGWPQMAYFVITKCRMGCILTLYGVACGMHVYDHFQIVPVLPQLSIAGSAWAT